MTFRQPLSQKDWKDRLQFHYLQTDGPNGKTPLDSLDATPSELRVAAGLDDLSDEEVLRAFMSIFSRERVRKVLGTEVSAGAGLNAYRHFHYLVLTCVVTATTSGAGETRNFRERMGELLGDGGGSEQGVQGVNSLWRALSKWVGKEIDQGKPLRAVVLPDPGAMTQIGYAVRLAYPSWVDRTRLKRVLKRIPERSLENPSKLIQRLCSEDYNLPPRMREDVDGLREHLRQNRPLEKHSMWRLLESVLAELSQDEPGRAALLWCLSVSFGGWDGDELEVSLARGNHRSQLETPYWFGSFEELLDASHAPIKVRKLLDSGVIILHEVPGGRWVQDDQSAPGDRRAIIVSSCEDITASLQNVLSAGRGWIVSEPMAYADAIARTGGRGVAKKETAQPIVQVEGGVSLGRGKWLNRPGFLPFIRLNQCQDLSASPELALTPENGIARIEASSPPDERWRVEAKSSDSTVYSTSFRLQRNAPLAARWAERSERHEKSVEVLFEDGPFLTNGRFPTQAGQYPNRMADVLEAIYARAGAARPEGEIIQILKRAVPSHLNPWDILRSLEEAGWVVQDLNRQWRGRFWRVRAPYIVLTGEKTALVEGALGSEEIEYLRGASEGVSVDIAVNAERQWSAPVFGLIGECIPEVAEQLQWKIFQAKIPKLRPAPACWPDERRTTQGRQYAGTWQAERKQFVFSSSANGPTCRLKRFVRDDDRDVYSIEGHGDKFLSSQRVVAFLEYFRRSGNPQFELADSILRSKASGCHLPLPIAQWLRRASCVQTGPEQPDSRSSHYVYGVAPDQLSVLVTAFGEAIYAPGFQNRKQIVRSLSKQRRRGERLSFYKHGGAGFYG